MVDWARDHLALTSADTMSRFNKVKDDPSYLDDSLNLRKLLLDFVTDFADWDHGANESYIRTCGLITSLAHESLGGVRGTKPLVVDPFAGGGSIPLEALRVGADTFASDLNPVPVLLNRVVLDYIPKYGKRLSEAVRLWGDAIRSDAESRLARFYDSPSPDQHPHFYLWSRTVLSEEPATSGEPVEVPLLRSMWLAKRSSRDAALRWVRDSKGRVKTEVVSAKYGDGQTRQVRRPLLEIFSPSKPSEVEDGTVKRGAVTCPVTGYTTPVKSVRAQLRARRGGTADARLLAIRQEHAKTGDRSYRMPAATDFAAVKAAAEALEQIASESLIPSEEFTGLEPRRIPLPQYGIRGFRDLFTPRQLLVHATLVQAIQDTAKKIDAAEEAGFATAVHTCLALALDRLIDFNSSLCVLNSIGSPRVAHTFGRQALPMVWDFIETNVFNGSGANWNGGLTAIELTILEQSGISTVGHVERASATHHPLPDDCVQALVTDPPYYFSVPYADLSDFFYVWLKRSLANKHPDLFSTQLTPKDEECVQNLKHSAVADKQKDRAFFERTMLAALDNARRICAPDALATIVFAHASTEAWEAMLSAVLAAGWQITASWPIDTERAGRLIAQRQSSLGSSVHLVCRPRENPDGSLSNDTVGDWREVLSELPQRIHSWMPRLADEGVVGADAIFACLGPALEIFSCHSRVEKASGEVVTLREYLEQVWAAVSTEALSMIFRDADAAGLESDARFTAIVLWTLGTGGSGPSVDGEGEDAEDEDAGDEDDEGESAKGKAAKGGFTLEYDAARKIAQGLGVNLDQIDSVVEVKGDKARLLPVRERAAKLFDKAEKTVATTKKRGKKATQKKLFDKDAEEGSGKTETVTLGDGAAATPGITALDRVHQAMLLFGNGRADALKRFIIEDGVGGDARFWKLAQSLSALYPAGSDEKRWVDGVLARKKSFGF